MARIRSLKPEAFQSETPYRKKRVPAAIRREVATRYGAKPGELTEVVCYYCDAVSCVDWTMQRYWPIFGFELDHRIPEFRGGSSTADNLVLACRPCNRKKGHKL